MNDYPAFTAHPPMYMQLRRRREELHLRQADVAEALGVSAEAVCLWESARRRVELCKVPRLAQTLQMDPRELCFTALEEYHPAFFQGIFGPHNETSAAIKPAA